MTVRLIRNIPFPDGLWYDVDEKLWLRREPDGIVTIGITPYACALAGDIFYYTPKRPGLAFERRESIGVVEMAKTVQVVHAPIAGTVVANNEDETAKLCAINRDPFGHAWCIRVMPADWARDAAFLVTGDAVIAAVEADMDLNRWTGTEAPRPEETEPMPPDPLRAGF
jgi:glycine cleavage system H protein